MRVESFMARDNYSYPLPFIGISRISYIHISDLYLKHTKARYVHTYEKVHPKYARSLEIHE